MNKTKTKMRQVEYYRLWPGNGGDSGTWDTSFVEIPTGTPHDKIHAAIREAVAGVSWRDDEPPMFVGFYAWADDEVDEDFDGVAEPPLSDLFNDLEELEGQPLGYFFWYAKVQMPSGWVYISGSPYDVTSYEEKAFVFGSPADAQRIVEAHFAGKKFEIIQRDNPKKDLPEGPLTLEFFDELPAGTELLLHYWCFNRGDMRFKYDHRGQDNTALNEERVFGSLWDDRPNRDPGWTQVDDFLYEFMGTVCRGSGAEPVHAVPPREPDLSLRLI